jgi:DNA-binding transcriptional LysR family regulator
MLTDAGTAFFSSARRALDGLSEAEGAAPRLQQNLRDIAAIF